MRWRRITLAAGLFSAVAACGDAGFAEDEAAGGVPTGGSGAWCEEDADCLDGYQCFQNQCVFQGAAGPGAGPSGADAGLPEREVESFEGRRPAAGKHYVFIPSPATDRVVRVHAQSLAIRSLPVGDEPTEIRTVPGEDTAVVLDHGSDEVSVIRVEGDDDQIEHFSLPAHFNAITLTPEGDRALCWMDLGAAEPGEDTAALQEVAVVELDDGHVERVSIGFRPREVVFPEAGGRALFVTEDGLSIVMYDELDGPAVARTVPLAVDIFAHVGREVRVTSDGAFAISRGPGEPGVTIVELAEGIPRFVDLESVPTDLDLLPDGDTALVMLRDAERLALVPIREAATDPDTVVVVETPGHALGSAAVGAAGEVAVLYTTVIDSPQVTLLDLRTAAYVHRPLRKGVAGVAVDPTGASAWVLHTRVEDAEGPAETEEERLARSPAYSLLDLRSSFARLVTTAADPTDLLFADDGSDAFVVIHDPGRGESAIHRIGLSAYEVEVFPLGARPEALGALPAAARVFVSQAWPEGRISFLDLDADRLETVSGFALNERID